MSKGYFELFGTAAFVHNGTLLATIEQDLGCQAMARTAPKIASRQEFLA
ncbi:MAG TPA: hypothetical protein VK734_12860 [Bradyrhizobium sp.]|jgi:hypothetical protein|nr:hypothetical protein [Bradyrhizobium sp.]